MRTLGDYKHVDAFRLHDIAPNLDGMLIGDLQQASKELNAVSEAFRILARYAECKEAACAQRANGHISLAQKCEAEADRVYDSLPEWARW